MMKAAVRAGSRSGNTKAVAEAIAQAAGVRAVPADAAKKAVIFSTSWLSKHAVDLIRRGLTEAGIPAEAAYFYAKNRPDDAQLKEAAAFAERFL